MPGLLGHRDEHLGVVEAAFPGSRVHVRGNEITVAGQDAERAGRVLEELVRLLQHGERVDRRLLDRAIDMVKRDEVPSDVLTADLVRAPNGRRVRPRSAGQKRYLEAVAANTVTLALGPAGTGKTWLAVAAAVQSLTAREVSRIVLTRPAVEAGERLGFLPGDLMDKVDPYLRPLFDALYDMLDVEQAQRYLERGMVEVAPLAFMRGRTLNDSFIILDEAQNTTPEQMKMFLTRIGFGSRAVVTGDTTQVDVPGDRSGLVGLEDVVGHIDGVEFVHLGGRDIVRHPIVQQIVDAYETRGAAPARAAAAAGRRR